MTLPASPPAPAATVRRPAIPAPLVAHREAPSPARPPFSLAAALYRLAFLLLCRLALGPTPAAHDDAR